MNKCIYIYIYVYYHNNIMPKFIKKEPPIKQVIDTKLKVIDIIIDMFPDLKKNKIDIINTVFGKLSKPTKYIFTKILLNGDELYIDYDGLLLTKNLIFQGFIINNKQYLLDDKYCDNIDINKFVNIILNK